jgi:hypothetical protein
MVDSGAGNDLINKGTLKGASHLIHQAAALRRSTAESIRLAKDRTRKRLNDIGYNVDPRARRFARRIVFASHETDPILIYPRRAHRTLVTERVVPFVDEAPYFGKDGDSTSAAVAIKHPSEINHSAGDGNKGVAPTPAQTGTAERHHYVSPIRDAQPVSKVPGHEV